MKCTHTFSFVESNLEILFMAKLLFNAVVFAVNHLAHTGITRCNSHSLFQPSASMNSLVRSDKILSIFLSKLKKD